VRLLLILLFVANIACGAGFVTEEAMVTEVIDGDTIIVEFDDGILFEIYLIGIDAPENESTLKGKLDPLGGPIAAEHLEDLVGDETVILEIILDKQSVDRLLAFVYLPVDEEPGKRSLINFRMIKDGYAIADPGSATGHKFDEVFIKAEEDAETEERGLWGMEKVYLTTTREVYHVAGCQYLKDVESPETISRLGALREGVEPCEICQDE